MVMLEVIFHCDACNVEIKHKIRIGPHFFLGADNLPDGWLCKPEEHAIRTWCPIHAFLAK